MKPFRFPFTRQGCCGGLTVALKNLTLAALPCLGNFGCFSMLDMFCDTGRERCVVLRNLEPDDEKLRATWNE